MVKARKAKRKQEEEPSRPSMFFIVAMIIGFLILIWWFAFFLPERATGEDEENAAIPTPVHITEAGALADG